MRKIYVLITIILLSSIDEASAQKRRRRTQNPTSSKLKGEVGGDIGISNFHGDFWNRGPIGGLVAGNGFAINGTYSIHRVPLRRTNRDKFMNHLVLKSNIGYTRGNFNNNGISSGKELLPADLTKAQSHVLLGRLSSTTNVFSIGTQLEYYLNDMFSFLHRRSTRKKGIRAYDAVRRYNRFNPYLGLGFGFNYVDSKFKYDSDLIANQIYPDNYVPEVLGGISKVILSFNGAIGTRYKLNKKLDLVGELKVNFYLSDRIDAVNTDPSPVIKNEFNDYNTVLSVGAIYHIFKRK